MKLIAFVYLLHFTRYGTLYPLVPLYAQQMGCSSSTIGLVVGSFSILSLFLALPIGDLADRFSTRAMMLWGAACNIVASWLLMIAGSVALLITAQIIGGLGFLFLIVSSQAYVGQFDDMRRRERGFAFLTFSAAIGQAVGPCLGGLMLSRFDFQWAFGFSLLLALLGLSIAGLPRQGDKMLTSPASLQEKAHQFRAYLSDSKMAATLVFTFVVIFVVSLRSSFIPVLFKANDLEESSIGLLLSISALSMTLVRFVVGWLMGRFSRSFLAAWAMGCVCVGVVFLPETSLFTLLVVMMMVFGCGFGITQPLSMVMVSDLTVPGYTGLAMGIRFMTVMAAALLSPLILGFVADAFGLAVAFYAAAALLALVGVWVAAKLRR
jgi:MFS family permease